MNTNKRDMTMSIDKGQIVGTIVGIIPSMLVVILYYQLWRKDITDALLIFDNIVIDILLYIAILVTLIIIHEVLHCVGFLTCKEVQLKDVKIDVWWKKLTPFATCSKAVDIRTYRFSIMLPTVILGILPVLYALLTGNNFVMLYAIIMLASGGGDMAVMWMLRKEKRGVTVKDHPTKMGCELYDSI
ncbi:DUF3267 domain-containing protein [Vallitalea okinawensis]|uniref:DUF3267 domain-containing protein n=1 Tax=Vallitalea okinawensis TaxID=2078660 RepID=UPI000CFDE309|nr:DUF3267 domain-containing protein [Vallitalea okinawensis]